MMEISGDQIEPAPSLGTQVDTDFILGMAKSDSAVKILLDIDKVLSADEVAALSKTKNDDC
ncbi:MAG: chemotaxis protein CheW [Desulfovermiculus sp.]